MQERAKAAEGVTLSGAHRARLYADSAPEKSKKWVPKVQRRLAA